VALMCSATKSSCLVFKVLNISVPLEGARFRHLIASM
jgi:hypothetical protein